MVVNTKAHALIVEGRTAFVFGPTKGMVAGIGAGNVKSMEMQFST